MKRSVTCGGEARGVAFEGPAYILNVSGDVAIGIGLINRHDQIRIGIALKGGGSRTNGHARQPGVSAINRGAEPRVVSHVVSDVAAVVPHDPDHSVLVDGKL